MKTTCWIQDCSSYPARGVHHHVHFGPDDAHVHSGFLEDCKAEPCVLIDHVETAKAKKAESGSKSDIQRQVEDIAAWWIGKAGEDATKTIPKAVEYGAVDFDLMGTFMVALIEDKLGGADDAEKARIGREMAVTFYLIGKMGRMIGAYAVGVMPSDDTLYDTSVYSMMLRRIRETGHWVK